MKVAILAGGLGSRLAEETRIHPKPLVEIGGRPILWHIMKQYEHAGYNEFFIALGFKGEMIKRYFLDYCSLSSNLHVSLKDGEINRHDEGSNLNWDVHLIDTGIHSMTGGRIKRLEPYLNDGTFMLTWGDGVSNVDLKKLLQFHKSHGKLATLTAVRPPARYGHLDFDGDRVSKFSEKPQTSGGWINGAFFVLEPEIFQYIDGDATQWEKEPLEGLAADNELMAYRHDGFWQCMDTMREKQILETLWESGAAPWSSKAV
jgi:glucose-1-phosphate cytidylyltransferase